MQDPNDTVTNPDDLDWDDLTGDGDTDDGGYDGDLDALLADTADLDDD